MYKMHLNWPQSLIYTFTRVRQGDGGDQFYKGDKGQTLPDLEYKN